MNDFIVLVDSKEKFPYTFQSIKPDSPLTKRTGLKTGDYSVGGMENLICVERKSLSDLYGSIGKGRERFENEMRRMAEFEYAAIVIEADIKAWFTTPPARSRMNPKAVFRSLIAFSQRYNVHVWPMWDRQSAEKLTYIILKRFYDDFMERNIN